MNNQPPKNHHFVPQHFLKAWQSSEGKIIRYRHIPSTGAFEVKEVAIKKTASVNDLYRIEFPDGSFEIESTLVTPLIDEPGHKIIEKARISCATAWAAHDKRQLAYYLTCLEARHPEVLKAMNINDHLETLRRQMKSTRHASHESIDEVIDYLKQSRSLGEYAFGLLVQNETLPLIEQPFSDGLVAADMYEYGCESGGLICSDYPTSRWGNYLRELLFIIAISPRKALVYSNSPKGFGQLPASVRTRLINLYTLAKAKTAYFTDASQSDFIAAHLGWATKLQTFDEQKRYISDFVMVQLSGARL
jgi:hypothetical protein